MVLAVWTADAGRAFADLGLQGCPPGPSFSHFATPATTIGVPLPRSDGNLVEIVAKAP